METTSSTLTMDYIIFAGQLEHISEAVSIMQCAGMTDDQIFRYLERKLGLGRFAK